jgi:hypothetical protein
VEINDDKWPCLRHQMLKLRIEMMLFVHLMLQHFIGLY